MRIFPPFPMFPANGSPVPNQGRFANARLLGASSLYFAGQKKKKATSSEGDTLTLSQKEPVSLKTPSENKLFNGFWSRELYQSAWAADIPEIEKALAEGADINYQNPQQNFDTPLMVAIRLNHQELAEFLLKRGANPGLASPSGKTALHVAVNANRPEMVRLLAATEGVPLNAAEKQEGYTALHGAAEQAEPAMLESLLSAKASLKTTTNKGETALHLAARNANANVLRAILKRKAPIEATSNDGYTALHEAAGNGTAENTRLLLEAGANPNVFGKAPSFFTPLHLAASSGYLESCKALIEHSAEVDPNREQGVTPFYMSVGFQHHAVNQFLAKQGADSSIQDKNGVSALDIAGDISEAYREQIAEMTRFARMTASQQQRVIEADLSGAFAAMQDPRAFEDEFDPDGRNYLHKVVSANEVEAAKILLTKGYKPNEPDAVGLTALHLAACTGNMDMMKALVGAHKKTNVNLVTHSGDTPLHIAVKNNQLEMIPYLHSLGAKLDVKDHLGCTPLNTAVIQGQTEAALQLIALGAKGDARLKQGYSTMHLASQMNNVVVMDALKQKGIPVHIHGGRQMSPLHVAAMYGSFEAVQYLLAQGAAVDTNLEGGVRPLHLAARSGFYKVVKLLLDQGADVNDVSGVGTTPLHLAAQGEDASIIRKLDQYLVNMHQQESHRVDPERFMKTVRLLVEHGALLNSQTPEGYTPTHLAVAEGQSDIASYLIGKGAAMDPLAQDGSSALSLKKDQLSQLFYLV